MPPSQPLQIEFALPNEQATVRLGAALACALEGVWNALVAEGVVIALSGDLGAGKTSLVRALLRTLGVAGPVKSPSFALVEPYVVSSLNFYHLDFYRIANPEEFSFAGFRELFGPASVCLIEWPEKAGRRLPTPDLSIALRVTGEGRHATLAAATELGATCLQHVRVEMARSTA